LLPVRIDPAIEIARCHGRSDIGVEGHLTGPIRGPRGGVKTMQAGDIDARRLTAMIDHTLLKAEATETAIGRLCQEAEREHFWAVCVNPVWASFASSRLSGTSVKVCVVAGFPLGASRPDIKAKEAEAAVRDGAAEVDMVANLGRLIERDFSAVAEDIALVRRAVPAPVRLKVIIESALLSDDLKVEAVTVVRDQGADFVKTSTGFHPSGGATVADVRLLKQAAGPTLGVKASGGIRDLTTAVAMLEAGADRLGMSAGVQVVQEFRRRGHVA
jgi:deoxyribose-phosphate aldolase